MTEPVESKHPVWALRAKFAFGFFALVGVFLLLAEHRAHVLPFLPWVFLAACPLMHLFMHGGHGHGQGHRHDDAANTEPPAVESDPPANDGGSGHELQRGRS